MGRDAMSEEKPILTGDMTHTENAVSLRRALEHIVKHDEKTILMVRVAIGESGLEVVVTSCARTCTEEDEIRIAKAILPEVDRLVRGIIKRKPRGEP